MDPVQLSQRLLGAARAGDAAERDEAITQLATVKPDTIAGDAARVAFWLNVYNARLLHALREHPRSGHLFRHRRMFRATGYELDGERFSLDQIEHGLLRSNRRPPFALRRTLPGGDPRLDAAPAQADPRIHFALNCGAASCPPISVYDEAGVDSQLDAATRAYLAAESEIDPERGTVVLPGLMRLYRADFEVAGGPLEFALTYLPTDAAAELRSRPELRLEWSRFDWTLVGAQSPSEDFSAK